MFVISYPWILYLLLRCIKNLWLWEFFVEIVHRNFCRVTGLCCCSPVIWTWPWPLWWICQGQLSPADVQYPSRPHWSRYCTQWFKRFLFFTHNSTIYQVICSASTLQILNCQVLHFMMLGILSFFFINFLSHFSK